MLDGAASTAAAAAGYDDDDDDVCIDDVVEVLMKCRFVMISSTATNSGPMRWDKTFPVHL